MASVASLRSAGLIVTSVLGSGTFVATLKKDINMKIRAFILAIIMAFVSTAAFATDLRVCTGGPNGGYFRTASEIASTLKGTLTVEVIETNGSLDNLRKLEAGECDAAIVQSDAYGDYISTRPASTLNIERLTPLYTEYANLICNRNVGIGKVGDLRGKDLTVAVGPTTSGTAVTWRSLVKQSPDFAEIKTDSDPISNRTVAKLVDATDIQCALFISGLGSGTLLEVNANANGALGLISFDHEGFDDLVDPKGKRVYENSTIPGGTYPGLQNYGFLGGQSDIPTIRVTAVLVANVAWADANAAAYDDFAGAALQWVAQHQ